MLALRSAVLISCLGLVALAQTFRGNISGIVSDSSGAALPQAVVTLENPSTGFVRTTTATGSGDFQFAELPLGNYTITVTHPGFETKKITQVEVAVSRTTNINVQLGVATQQSLVEVSAAAVNLETSSSSLAAVVNTKTVQDLPLNGRDFRQMVKLAPGVTPSGTSVNGMRTNGNNYQIDGADNNDAWSNGVSVNQGGVAGIAGSLLPIDAIDQFSVQTNAAADMGRNGGSNVNMVIKSGTNSLHGSLYYFNRNEALAALSPLQAPGSPKQEIRNNQFGFSGGGPIIRNKTFFFFTGEAQLAIGGESLLDTSPSAAWVSAGEAVLAKYGMTPNPVSLNLLSLWPANSRSGPATANNYLANALNTYNSFNGIVKIDHTFNEKQTLSFRYLVGTGTQVADYGAHYKDYFQEAPEHVHNFSVVENWVISPRMVNQVTLGVNYFLQTFNDFNTSFDPIALGLNTGVPQTFLSGAPTIHINGFDFVGATQPAGRTDATGHVTDNLSYTAGRHQFKFGGEFRRAVLDVPYFLNARGSFTFDGSRGPWATDSSVSGTLRSMADFLAGFPTNSAGATIVEGLPDPIYLQSSGDWWVHDTFQVNSQLSVNFGVRYTYQGVLHDRNNLLTNFVPGQGFTSGELYQKDGNNFAPRFGFAYAPKRMKRTVIRGGYGIYYDVPTVGAFAFNSATNGAAQGVVYNPGGPDPVYSLSLKNVVIQNGVPVFGGATPVPPFGVFGINRSLVLPYVQNFNLNIQRQLTASTMLQVGYVGSLGRKLLTLLDINQPINGVRPLAAQYPTLASINQLNSIANSNYNSLQTSLRQQFWKGLAANLNYTWSHAIDDASSVGIPANSYNLENDRGSSTFDTRHIVTGFISYQAPQLANFFPRLTKGWQLNALTTFTSGSPINITAGTNVSGTGEGKDRVDLVGDPFANVPVLTNTLAMQYFNPAAFAKPAAGTFGNLGRDVLYGPGFGSVDFSVFKRTPITERITTELRFEILNVLNRTNWANPTTTFTSASFGELTQTKNGSSAPGLGFGEPRNVQLGLKIIF